jgi:monomeric isocitrate dehydrogenase
MEQKPKQKHDDFLKGEIVDKVKLSKEEIKKMEEKKMKQARDKKVVYKTY